jgi:glycerol kinase
MMDNVPAVSEAHGADDLLFGTVESWIVYVNHSSSFHGYESPLTVHRNLSKGDFISARSRMHLVPYS